METETAVPLPHFRNARVTIYYQAGVTDTGALTYFDATWVELLKDNGERLLIPVMAIRIIKLLETSKALEAAQTLLRPAEGIPPQIEK